MKKRVLVIDVGGSHVKLMMSWEKRRKFDSGRDLNPKQAVERIKEHVKDWNYDVVSIGFPSPVRNGRIMVEPKNLGRGWIDFDFRKALGKPVQVINDAAMQAVGSYRGGRMLFLGLGTGLGSTLIWNNNVLSLELGDLPYVDSQTLEDRLGKDGMKKMGKSRWADEVLGAVTKLRKAFIADYVVLGGGNAKLLESLPAGVERGHNRNACLGGARLWQANRLTQRRKWQFV